MRLGVFTMPLHDTTRDYTQILEEDRQAIILADRLGYDEYWMGEHFSSMNEPVPSPLMLMASVIPETKNIVFGTGVINLPQHHPVAVAAEVAQFDHMCKGRYIFGIGVGSLVSDVSMVGTGEPPERGRKLMEALDIVNMLWSQDPPYDFEGEFWTIKLDEGINEKYRVGWVPRPYQQPHPPIAISVLSPNSRTALEAGKRGWIPVSGNFMHSRYLRSHWEMYAKGAAEAGQPADPAIWRVARSILIGESTQQALDNLADPASGISNYYNYFHYSFTRRGALTMGVNDESMRDEDITVDHFKEGLPIVGDSRTVLDRLIALVDEIGPFGTLLANGHEWDDPALWQGSMRRLAEDVMPKLSQHADSLRAAAD